MKSPALETERLLLRPHQAEDYPAFREFWMSERAGFIGGPLTHDFEVWRQFTAERGHWAFRGFGLWTLVERVTGNVLGWVGLQQPPHYESPELAWHLTAAAEGRGLAYEAARAALDHGRRSLGMTRVISYVAEENARSSRLAERLGAQRESSGSFQDSAFHLYVHAGSRE